MGDGDGGATCDSRLRAAVAREQEVLGGNAASTTGPRPGRDPQSCELIDALV